MINPTSTPSWSLQPLLNSAEASVHRKQIRDEEAAPFLWGNSFSNGTTFSWARLVSGKVTHLTHVQAREGCLLTRKAVTLQVQVLKQEQAFIRVEYGRLSPLQLESPIIPIPSKLIRRILFNQDLLRRMKMLGWWRMSTMTFWRLSSPLSERYWSERSYWIMSGSETGSFYLTYVGIMAIFKTSCPKIIWLSQVSVFRVLFYSVKFFLQWLYSVYNVPFYT